MPTTTLPYKLLANEPHQYCLPRQRILQQSYCRKPRARFPRICHWWSLLVRNPLVVRQHSGHDCSLSGGHSALEPRRRHSRSCPALCRRQASRLQRRSMHNNHDLHGSHLRFLCPADCCLIHLHLRYLPGLHRPIRQGQASRLGFAHDLCVLGHRHGRLLHRSLLRWYRNGLPLPADGRDHLLCSLPRRHVPHLEAPELDRSSRLATPRPCSLPYRLARDNQETIRHINRHHNRRKVSPSPHLLSSNNQLT